MQQGKSQIENKRFEGWTWLSNSRKWHYFTPTKISLCGKFALFGNSDLEQGNDASLDNCAVCRKKLKAFQDK